jgi:SAM-dependent methyltransferase
MSGARFISKMYFRDVWVLGPNDTGYPGGFPRGLIGNIKRHWWGNDRLWLFSGSFRDPSGITLDIKRDTGADVCADAKVLPFADETFDFVMADPPYSEKEAKELYNLPYFNVVAVLNEMARVCKPGGHILFLHRLYPGAHPSFNQHFSRLELRGIIGVLTNNGLTNMRALTVMQKTTKLADFVPPKEAAK